MVSLNLTSGPNGFPPPATSQKVPRLDSLFHRLQHGKDASGQPLPLREILLHFLDDPPPGVTDRWDLGAEFCRLNGISANRMTVWRFYRSCLRRGHHRKKPKVSCPPPAGNTSLPLYSAP